MSSAIRLSLFTGKAMHIPRGDEFDGVLEKLGQKSPYFKNWLLKDEFKTWIIYKMTAATLQYTDFSKSKKTITEEI
jgi:hypothetical protein